MEERKSKPMTVEEFDKLPEDNTQTYELIDGELIMQARPSFMHQNIMNNLHGALFIYLKGKPCKAFTEVELEIDKNVIVPDISIFCNLKSTNIQRTTEPPSLVIEIISPSNSITEMNRKMNKYKNHGIDEFWLVDPINYTITKYNLGDNTAMTYIKSGSLVSTVFLDLEIKLSDIFE